MIQIASPPVEARNDDGSIYFLRENAGGTAAGIFPPPGS